MPPKVKLHSWHLLESDYEQEIVQIFTNKLLIETVLCVIQMLSLSTTCSCIFLLCSDATLTGHEHFIHNVHPNKRRTWRMPVCVGAMVARTFEFNFGG